MSVLNIRKAVRAGARLVVSLAGISGSGKTRTALELAWGLANGKSEKVGLLDTENRRGSLYADCLKDANGVVQPFMVGDLEPPFSPQRYIDAIKEFQAAGVEVLVIDSVSHEWEGTGGCEEIATAQNPRMPDWATAKRAHKSFVNALLQSDMHIIVCVRAREKVKMSKENGRTVVESQGIQPVCEKNFMFEMTASVLMESEGLSQLVIKCPDELRSMLGRGQGYITKGDGLALRAWVDGAAQLDPEVEHARNTLRTVTEGGVEAYRQAWEKTPKKIQRALVGDGSHETLKTSAAAFDQARIEAKRGGAELDGLNKSLDDDDVEAG